MIKYKTLLKVISKIYLKTYNKKTFQVFKHDFVLQNIKNNFKKLFLKTLYKQNLIFTSTYLKCVYG